MPGEKYPEDEIQRGEDKISRGDMPGAKLTGGEMYQGRIAGEKGQNTVQDKH